MWRFPEESLASGGRAASPAVTSVASDPPQLCVGQTPVIHHHSFQVSPMQLQNLHSTLPGSRFRTPRCVQIPESADTAINPVHLIPSTQISTLTQDRRCPFSLSSLTRINKCPSCSHFTGRVTLVRLPRSSLGLGPLSVDSR